jgi:hypothetical protein
MSDSSWMGNLEAAMMVMDICRGSFESVELADYTERMVQQWMTSSQSKSIDIKWVHYFLAKSIDSCQSVDFDTRTKLARLKAELADFEPQLDVIGTESKAVAA